MLPWLKGSLSDFGPGCASYLILQVRGCCPTVPSPCRHCSGREPGCHRTLSNHACLSSLLVMDEGWILAETLSPEDRCCQRNLHDDCFHWALVSALDLGSTDWPHQYCRPDSRVWCRYQEMEPNQSIPGYSPGNSNLAVIPGHGRMFQLPQEAGLSPFDAAGKSNGSWLRDHSGRAACRSRSPSSSFPSSGHLPEATHPVTQLEIIVMLETYGKRPLLPPPFSKGFCRFAGLVCPSSAYSIDPRFWYLQRPQSYSILCRIVVYIVWVLHLPPPTMSLFESAAQYSNAIVCDNPFSFSREIYRLSSASWLCIRVVLSSRPVSQGFPPRIADWCSLYRPTL